MAGPLRDYGLTVGVAIALALGIRFFVIEAYRIPTSNMRPTLEPGDTIFVVKWPFGLRFPGQDQPFTTSRPPQRGEVVVYTQPGESPKDSIRRVIAEAGDTFEVRKGNVILNGKEIKEPGQSSPSCGFEKLADQRYAICIEPPAMEDIGPEKIPAGQVLLMGDYRVQWIDDLHKQKNWQIVPVAALRGLARWTWLSIDPPSPGAHASGFARIRFERMFKEIH